MIWNALDRAAKYPSKTGTHSVRGHGVSQQDNHRIDRDVEQEVESEMDQGERNPTGTEFHVSEPSPNVIYTPCILDLKMMVLVACILTSNFHTSD